MGAALSVVIVTPDGYAAIRRTVLHLAAQTISGQLELVMVAPGRRDLEGREELQAFHSVATVEVGRIASTGRALAAGFRRATAPLIACAEEHSFPEPGWAEALVETHRGPWAAVGAELENANPASAVSWAHLFTDFGSAVAPASRGPAQELPGHHVAYKREALRRYAERLDQMLEQEWVLHDDLKVRGERLYLEPNARAWHLNVSTVRAQLLSEYHGGRMFGASRARLRGWSPARRAAYVVGSPGIPLLRFARILRHIRRAGRLRLLPRLLPPLALGLLANAAGQALGYALGAAGSTEQRIEVELHRWRHLSRADLAALEAMPPPGDGAGVAAAGPPLAGSAPTASD